LFKVKVIVIRKVRRFVPAIVALEPSAVFERVSDLLNPFDCGAAREITESYATRLFNEPSRFASVHLPRQVPSLVARKAVPECNRDKHTLDFMFHDRSQFIIDGTQSNLLESRGFFQSVRIWPIGFLKRYMAYMVERFDEKSPQPIQISYNPQGPPNHVSTSEGVTDPCINN
jgi:hypothetical protein